MDQSQMTESPGEEQETMSLEDKNAHLVVFGQSMTKLRDDAVKGRAASGIEQEWQEDEEHYEGIDDANRSEMAQKSTHTNGPVRLGGDEAASKNRSTIFLNISRPYVDAASARVSDMLLPTDERNWDIRPTPVPDLMDASKNEAPAVVDGQQVMKPQTDESGQPMLGPDGQPQQVQAQVKDLALEAIEKAKQSAEKARNRIDDWLTESRYHAEVRQVIESAARTGTGILKGPIPKKIRMKAMVKTMEGAGIVIKQAINPVSKCISIWNLYPDPACGDNIHNGKHIWEYDQITGRQLRDLKGLGYIDEAIDACLEEGPKSALAGKTNRQMTGEKAGDKHRYDIWYGYVMVEKDDLEAAGCEVGEMDGAVPAIVTLVNDRVIRANLSQLDSGEFPYDVMVWQKRVDHWAGIGVTRQMRTCQRGVNAAARNLMDNAGLSAGPQIIVDRTKIEPANGRWEITPRKIWWAKQDAEIQSVRDAFIVVQIQSLQQELVSILQLFMKFAEDVTGLPMLIQGQQGSAPETVGGMTMLNNNATSVLRRIARLFDDFITEPHIGRYYEWLLIYGPDESEKGDFNIDARGSSALVERDLQNQAMIQMVGLSLNPAYGLDPQKVIAEALKSQRIDPKKLELDEEKKQAMLQQQPPPAPQVQVAQINAQSRAAEKQAQQAFEAQEAALDRQLSQWEKNVDSRLKAAELAGDQSMSLQDVKAMLASVAMKLRTQTALSPGQQVISPPSEPAGLATRGNAYAQ